MFGITSCTFQFKTLHYATVVVAGFVYSNGTTEVYPPVVFSDFNLCTYFHAILIITLPFSLSPQHSTLGSFFFFVTYFVTMKVKPHFISFCLVWCILCNRYKPAPNTQSWKTIEIRPQKCSFFLTIIYCTRRKKSMLQCSAEQWITLSAVWSMDLISMWNSPK